MAGLVVLLVAAAGVVVAIASAGSDSPDSGSPTSEPKPADSASTGHRNAPRLGGPVATSAPGAHRAAHEAVPILMYHVIGTVKPDTPSPELWVSPADFRAEMHALAARGYHGVTLQQVWDAWHHDGLLPAKPVVVSFDDGYTGQWRDARPTLRALGWPGVLNLELQNLGDVPPWQIRQMIAAGWEIDSHTLTHPDLTTVGDDQLRHELVESRAQLRRQFGVPAAFFCYPAGRFDARVVAAVRAAGYAGATTTQLGFASPSQSPYELPRIRVNGSDGVAGLEKDLAQAATGVSAGQSQGE